MCVCVCVLKKPGLSSTDQLSWSMGNCSLNQFVVLPKEIKLECCDGDLGVVVGYFIGVVDCRMVVCCCVCFVAVENV